MKRTVFLSLFCLLVGFTTGALAYRSYMFAFILREEPKETGERPVFDGPAEVVENSQAVAPVAIGLVRHPKGFHVWEAEWANAITGTFAALASPDSSGGVAVWAREGTGRNNGSHPQDAPNNPHIELGSARWRVDLPEDGAYRLFMRIWALDKCGNSCWLGMDARDRSDLHYFPGGQNGRFGASRHVWPDTMLRRWLWLDDEGSIYRLKAGTHTLRVDVREDGFAIDQIALVPVGAKEEPAGREINSILPRQDRAPLSTSLALERYVLKPGSSQTTTGRYWVRLNSPDVTPVELELHAEGGTVIPGSRFAATLSPEHPILQVPFELRLPAATPRRAYRLSATVQSDESQHTSQSVHFAAPLDWWALGPLQSQTDRAVAPVLRKAQNVDVTRSPLKDQPHLAWTRIQPDAHYDAFGAVDLNLVFGPQEHRTAYLVTCIRVLRSGAYRILAAGDDTFKVRLGGTTVVDDRWHRPLTDSLRPYPVTLTEGTHLLVARTEQSRRWWQVFLEFQTPDGKPAASVIGVEMAGKTK